MEHMNEHQQELGDAKKKKKEQKRLILPWERKRVRAEAIQNIRFATLESSCACDFLSGLWTRKEIQIESSMRMFTQSVVFK